MRRRQMSGTARSHRTVLDTAQRLARLVIISSVILVLAYFALAAIVVVRTGDLGSIAEVGHAAAELIRALTDLSE